MQGRRPVDQAMIQRAQMRHLKNRRDTLVMSIIAAQRAGDLERVTIIREEANRVNEKLREVTNGA